MHTQSASSDCPALVRLQNHFPVARWLRFSVLLYMCLDFPVLAFTPCPAFNNCFQVSICVAYSWRVFPVPVFFNLL